MGRKVKINIKTWPAKDKYSTWQTNELKRKKVKKAREERFQYQRKTEVL
jgi:hypothetical protein